MEKTFIIHNPRCSKSRGALEILQAKGIQTEIIDYLNGGLTRQILLDFLQALKLSPKNLLRTKEDEFKALSLDVDNDEQVINAILKYPKILERPLVMQGKRAVIGRPPENVLELLK